ncbi:MAG: biotin/lipoyl-binding protein [Oscillospiraceae bacterium]|nr:biotin/lipoyl-binding protein [Oscillospiraceae bacterium]
MDEQRNDDVLFEALNREKKKKRNRRIRRIVIILAVVTLLLVYAVNTLQKRVRETVAAQTDAIKSTVAVIGTVSTTVSGSGTIRDEDTEEISVPAGVKITEVLVESGDKVLSGDVLATVENADVLNALADVQKQIDAKDAEMENAASEAVDEILRAKVSGRIKKIYTQPGDGVAACMVRNGALAVISRDGYMALEIENSSLKTGDTVSLLRADGSTLTGEVDRIYSGKAVILTDDRQPEVGEELTVKNSAGVILGHAAVYIHSPVRVTGYTGTVDYLSVKENDNVWEGASIFRLRDTKTPARYDSIVKEREELEKTLLALLTIYRDGALCAPFDGTVLTVEYDEDNNMAAAAKSVSSQSAAYPAQSGNSVSAVSKEETKVLTLSRDKKMSVAIPVDETDILALQPGQKAVLTVEAIGRDSYHGFITELDRSADSSGGVTSYTATVTFDKAEHMLAGMTADVIINISGRENVLILPAEAVNRTSASAYVFTGYVAETGMLTDPKTVTVGVSNEEYTEIRSGLSEGETVYYKENNSFDFMMGYYGARRGGRGRYGG